MKYSKILIVAAMSLALSACGGGSDSNPTIDTLSSQPSPANTDNTNTTSAGAGNNVVDQANLLTGRFVDSSVIGIAYETETRSGFTDSNGAFNYLANENVTFSIGDLVLPAVRAGSVVTPLDIFNTDSISDTRVLNLIRLLQTLDTDAEPDNGITISSSAISSATGLTADFASTNFENEVLNLVANSGSRNTSLVRAEDAMDHFMETLFAEGIQERPEAVTAENVFTQAPPSSGSATTAHPLVGTTVEFGNDGQRIFHQISGSLTVLDDRTIEVTNFNFDGQGVAVYFYLGTDGRFRGNQGGIEIPGLLNRGTPYVNETLTINLPAGVTLDDFNSISVWCVPFNASFAAAVF